VATSLKLVVGIVCLLGLFLRIAYIGFYNPEPIFPDEERFLLTATNIVNFGQIIWDGRRAWDMPLMSVLTASGLVIFDGNVLLVKFFLGALSSITIVLVANITFLLSRSAQATIICSIAMAIYPLFIFFSGLILTETLFLFLFSGMLMLVYSPKQPTSIFGLVSGLTHLTRPTILYFLPVIWAWQAFHRKISIRNIFLGVVAFFLVVNIWGIRNYSIYGEYFLSTASSGHVLLEGNNPWNTAGGPSGEFADSAAYKKSIPEGFDELAIDKEKRKIALTYMREHPVNTIKLAFSKLRRLWMLTPNSPEYQEPIYLIISFLTTTPVFILAALSLYVLRSSFKQLSILYAFILYYSLLHMITIGSLRYRLPIDLVLIILASLTLNALANKVKQYRQEKSTLNANSH
jgi:hypothetical protein